jgi:anthranilate phosphoribosyltransferase
MPWTNDRDIAALRMSYNVAVAAHSERARALTEALMRGDTSPEFVEAEATTRRLKEEARNKLHAAMAKAIGPPPELPPTKAR